MLSLKGFFHHYERHLSVGALVLGFIIDNVTLRRVDLLPETVLMYSYLALAAGSIFFIHLVEDGRLRWRVFRSLVPWVTLLLQLVFGGIFSAFLIFYSRSATLTASWPFLLLLLFIFVGTEIFKKHTSRLVFQLSIFFFSIFSLSVFAVPLALGTLGPGVFILSDIVSVTVFWIFFLLLLKTGPLRIRASARMIWAAVIAALIIMNGLYFENVLPPIPLALKEIGVYHSVERIAGKYVLKDESRTWLATFFRPVVHLSPGEPAYVFAAVFTPVAIHTDVVHRWARYDPATSEWQDAATIRFPIVGGRDQGYRGYSVKYGVTPGLWRVSVETPGGQLIGRIEFSVVLAPTPVPLTATTLP